MRTNSYQVSLRRKATNASPLCRCATSLPKGETNWIAREAKAFLPEEGGAAQAVTEGAARKQIRIKLP